MKPLIKTEQSVSYEKNAWFIRMKKDSNRKYWEGKYFSYFNAKKDIAWYYQDLLMYFIDII